METEGRGADDERAARLAQVEAMRGRGEDPYPVRFDRTHTLAEVREQWDDRVEIGQTTDDVVSVAIPPLITAPGCAVPSIVKLTTPVDVDGVIAAVRVTDCPEGDGSREDDSAVVVGDLLTVCITCDDVLPM